MGRHFRAAPRHPPVPTLGAVTDERARFLGAVDQIARMPDVAGRLRAAHTADRDGRCRGCPSAHSAAPRWPCRLRVLADLAELAAPGGAADGRTAARHEAIGPVGEHDG